MIGRREGLIALFGVALVIGVIWGIGFLGSQGDCMTVSDRGSCPALAEVNGIRYTVSVASEHLGLEADLAEYASITRSNVPQNFAGLLTYRIGDIDPTAVLAAPARHMYEEDVAPYRLLYGPNSSAAFPALCDYIPMERRQGDERCGAPA